MTAANFPAEFGDELVFEGGFVDDPHDPGGATDFGITLAVFSHWLGRPATVAELKAIRPDEEAAIYRTLFWNVVQGDALPAGVDLVVFDMAVNGGPRRAALLLQGIIGVAPDGVIGPATLAAVARRPAPGLISGYSANRQVYYRRLPTFSRFGDGWIARVHKCEAEALALAGAPVSDAP